jgi:hypothetical protein
MKVRMVAAKNNPVLLCKKPSQLIKLALKDLRQVEKMPDKYVVDMGLWHKPNSHCSVCFAGAVMAVSLKISHKANIIPNRLDNELLRFRLEALDSVRCGKVIGFVLDFFGSCGWEEDEKKQVIDEAITLVRDEFGLDGSIPVTSYPNAEDEDAKENRKQFHADMKNIATRLRKIGL